MTDVAVVVVTFNSEAVVEGLIESLPEGLSGCTWTLIVADNASSDDTAERVRRLAPAAQVIEMGRNAGYSAGINAALALADPGAAALILNPDIRLAPGAVAVMGDALVQPGVGIVVPRLVDGAGVPAYSLRREPTIRRSLTDALCGQQALGRFDWGGEVVTTPRSYVRATRADWAAGAAMLVSRECLATCGPWDESFFLYSEETEYCLRARDLGFATLLSPDAEAAHLGGESRVSARLRSLLVVNRIRLYRRRHSAIATVVFWLVAVYREATRAILRRPASRQVLATLLSRQRMRETVDRAAAPG